MTHGWIKQTGSKRTAKFRVMSFALYIIWFPFKLLNQQSHALRFCLPSDGSFLIPRELLTWSPSRPRAPGSLLQEMTSQRSMLGSLIKSYKAPVWGVTTYLPVKHDTTPGSNTLPNNYKILQMTFIHAKALTPGWYLQWFIYLFLISICSRSYIFRVTL